MGLKNGQDKERLSALEQLQNAETYHYHHHHVTQSAPTSIALSGSHSWSDVTDARNGRTVVMRVLLLGPPNRNNLFSTVVVFFRISI